MSFFYGLSCGVLCKNILFIPIWQQVFENPNLAVGLLESESDENGPGGSAEVVEKSFKTTSFQDGIVIGKRTNFFGRELHLFVKEQQA